jgi:hypothetical protein
MPQAGYAPRSVSDGDPAAVLAAAAVWPSRHLAVIGGGWPASSAMTLGATAQDGGDPQLCRW